MKAKILSLLIAAALSVGSAQAADSAKAPTAQQQATRAEIDKLVQRIQELSKQLGEDTDVRVMVRRAHDMRGMDRMDPMHAMHGDGELFGRPGLGIVMMPNAAANGVRIAAVTPDSPAMKAGLRSDDVLLSIDGKKIAGNGMAAVENARGLLGGLRQDQVVKLGYARQGKTGEASVKVDVIGRMMMFQRGEDGAMPAMPGMREHMERHIAMLPPDVEREIERIGPMKDCSPDSEDCHLPAMFEAFRWQGLNLASVDTSLGRYFGTGKGVLVLSSGPELKGLQSGDVIARVAGNEVKSPRDVMRALREKPVGSQVRIDLLRDHKSSAVTITVPKARALPFLPPVPPAPPAPPAPPVPPAAAPAAAPPAPPAPPVPPAPPRDDAAFAPEAMPSDLQLPIAQIQDIDRDVIEEIEMTRVLVR